jgi:hypothetical protein
MFPSAPVTAAMELAARGVGQGRTRPSRVAGPDARRPRSRQARDRRDAIFLSVAMIPGGLAAPWRPFTGIGRIDSTARAAFARFLHA